MRVQPAIATGDLDSDATMRPGEFLGGGHEQAPDAALAKVRSYHEAGDATEKAVFMNQRNAVKGQKADRAMGGLGDEYSRSGGSKAV
jgi:hypothetical protein